MGHGDPDDRRGRAAGPEPGEEPGLGAAGGRREDHGIDPDATGARLAEHLGRGPDLARRADDSAAADADGVRMAPGGPEVGEDPGNESVALGPVRRRRLVDRRAEELVELPAGVRWIGRRSRQDEVDVEPRDRPGRGRQPAVVRPASAGRDEAIGVLGQRRPDEHLEVAQLVAAEGQRKEVLALDPELGPAAERGRQPWQRGERRRLVDQREPGKIGQRARHGCRVVVGGGPYHRHPRRSIGWPFASPPPSG